MTQNVNEKTKVLEIGGGERPLYCKKYGNGINIDVRSMPTVDVVHDLNQLPMPLESNEFDYVYSRFLIEHISWRIIPAFISEIHRVLKPNGRAMLITANLLEQSRVLVNKPFWTDQDVCMVFGNQDYSENTHRAGFSPEYAIRLFKEAGFQIVEVAPLPQCHTDMVIVAVKASEMIVEKPWGHLVFSYDPVFLDADYETEIFALLPSIAKEGNVAFDIGAHQGIYASYLSKIVGKHGKVYAFEPHPTNFKYLQKNSSDNVMPLMKAMGSYDGKANLRAFHFRTTAHQFIEGDACDEVLPVDMVKVDSFVAENKIGRLDFMKVDVEHWEWEVLLGASQAIRNLKPTMLIETHSEENRELIRNFCRVSSHSLEEIKLTKGNNKNIFFLIKGEKSD